MSAATQVRSLPTARDGDPLRGRAGFSGLIWLTWRQHRWPIVIGAVTPVAMTAWMLVAANSLTGYAKGCTAHRCSEPFAKAASFASYQMNTLVFLPVLLAVFWGVPLLAREYEQRTLLLAWSQDVSPLRWLFGKTAILGVLVAAMGTLLAGTAEHLAHEYHAYTGTSLFEGTMFQGGGWLPLTLALAWLAFGIAAGAATRRTMPAIAAVAGVWIGGRIVLMPRLREKFMTPLTSVKPFSADSTARGSTIELRDTANDMMIGRGDPLFVDSHGGTHPAHVVMDQWCSDQVLNQSRGTKGADPMLACLQQHDIVGTLHTYQPASRMGTFHLIENGMNVGLLVLSLLVAWWCVRRTRTTT